MVLFQQRAQLGSAAKQTSHACRGGVSQPKCKPSPTNDMQTVCPEAPTPSPPAHRDRLIHDCILRTGSFKQHTLHTHKLAHRHHNTKKHSAAQHNAAQRIAVQHRACDTHAGARTPASHTAQPAEACTPRVAESWSNGRRGQAPSSASSGVLR
jgi:hypothetical protein